MKQSLPTMALASVYTTEVIALCNLYMFFSSTQANDYSYIELWPWLALSLGSFFLLRWFLRTPRPLPHIVAVTVSCFLVMGVVMSVWFVHVQSVMAWAFAWLFFAICIFRAAILSTEGSVFGTVLLSCELPMFGIAFLLWMNEGGVYHLPSYYLVWSVLALIWSLLSLTLSRLSSTSPAYGTPLSALAPSLVCISGLAGLAYLFVRFLSTFAASAVSQSSALLQWIWTTFWVLVTAFCDWLISLLPEVTTDDSALAMEATAVELPELAEESAMDPTVLIVFAAVLLASMAVGLLWLLFKHRKWKLTRRKLDIKYHRPKPVVKSQSIWKRLWAFWLAQLEKIRFNLRLWYKRNTPQGAAIVLAKIGKQRGLARLPQESYPCYLSRLQPLCQGVDDQSCAYLQTLIQALDATLYAPTPPPCSLTPSQYRHLRSTLRKLKKPSRKKEAV